MSEADLAEEPRIDELVRQVDRPPYDIIRVAHVELLVDDLDASARFYVDVLGLVESDRTDGAIYLRGWEEHIHHSLVLRRGSTPAVGHVAFRVRDEDDLEQMYDLCEATGTRVQWYGGEPHHGRALRMADPLGIPLEFFCSMEPVESRLRDFHGQRGAPLLRFDHVNLQVPDVENVLPFWTGHGFRCSEYLSTDGLEERLCGAWLYRKQTGHDLGLMTGIGPRLHHAAFAVADPLAVLHACDQLAAAGQASSIERGPGRHGATNAFFVYLRDPDGHRVELLTPGYFTGDPDLEPLRWTVGGRTARTSWGARAPQAWYDEATPFCASDGRPLPVHDTSVDERSELMS
jgi:3,4-dihydroxyphenylacetate 2,3-dioxygenase